MRIEEVGTASTTAILLAEVKEHLRIDGSAEDSQLNALIMTAERMIEAAIGIALISRQFDIYYNDWPKQGTRRLALPVWPLLAVNAVYLKDGMDTDTLWAANHYRVQTGLAPSISLAVHENWPALTQQTDGIRINITAGFGTDWNAVPADIHQALLLLITALYFNRGDGDQTNDLMRSSGAMAILSPYRRVRL